MASQGKSIRRARPGNPSRRDVRNALRMYAAAAPDAERAAAGSAAMGLDRPERVRAKPRDLEGAEQRALFHWARLQMPRMPELAYLHHVPNGGARDRITGARLKAQGVRAGAPDIYLDVARNGYHGLRIELKATEGARRVSPEQAAWIEHLDSEGYLARVCVGWESARDLIVGYLLGQYRAP